jgi:hypothetical protein
MPFLNGYAGDDIECVEAIATLTPFPSPLVGEGGEIERSEIEPGEGECPRW